MKKIMKNKFEIDAHEEIGLISQAGLSTQDSHLMREARDEEGQGILWCGIMGGAKAAGIIRRAIACWNAFHGIPTEDIENLNKRGGLNTKARHAYLFKKPGEPLK